MDVMCAVTNDSSGSSESERREAVDRIVDGIEFGELCNEFECISSPSIESTARQLVRDILELREGNRALGTFAVSVQYKVIHLFLHKSESSPPSGLQLMPVFNMEPSPPTN